MRVVVCLATTVALAWVGAVLAYVLALRLLFGETIGWGGELRAVLSWTAPTYVVCAVGIQLPYFFLVRWLLPRFEALTPYVLGGAALGLVPTIVLIYRLGGHLNDIVSFEALTFFFFFVVAGVLLSLGFIFCERPRRGPYGFEPILPRTGASSSGRPVTERQSPEPEVVPRRVMRD
jgi:hypothetical protein